MWILFLEFLRRLYVMTSVKFTSFFTAFLADHRSESIESGYLSSSTFHIWLTQILLSNF